MSLNAKAVDGLDLEGSALALWQEFLAGYFDGTAHQVGRAAVVFPKAVLRFQEASLPQPMKGVAISVVGLWGKETITTRGAGSAASTASLIPVSRS